MKIKERAKKLLQHINDGLFEKQEVVALSFLSIIATENIFLLGKPGVAKSMIARRLKDIFKGAKSFEYLMNRFSTPDELFGPISIKKLREEDKYERNIENYLPDCEIVFLDEIWKAGPSIQNALLTIINERIYRNGDKEIKTKLLGLIAASNELPEKNRGLEALWDRFIVRCIVTGVTDNENFNKLLSEDIKTSINVPPAIQIEPKELLEWQNLIDKVSIPPEIFNVINVIRLLIDESNEGFEEEEDKIYISDRRWRKIIKILKTSAFLNDRQEVDLMDCFLIGHCIWEEPDQIDQVFEIVTTALQEHGYSLNVPSLPIENQIKEFKKEVKRDTSTKKTYYKDVFIETNDRYEIEGLTQHPTYCMIEKDDYETINVNSQNFNVYTSANQRTTKYLKINGKQLQARISNSNTWYDVNIKTKKVAEEKAVSLAPNPRLTKEWNKVVDEITVECNKSINSIESYRKKKLSDLQNNLFVNSEKSIVVEQNLHDTIQKFQKLKLNIEKVKVGYESLR